MHCLRQPVERNWDHVFPKSWYPDTTPRNLAKWQIPSCLRCNRELGAIEQEFFVRVALCLDPKANASSGLGQRALRAMNPNCASSAADRRARASLAQKISAEILQGEQIPEAGHFPGLGERWDRPKQDALALLIPEASFRRITEKVVRGVTYLRGNRYIEPPFTVQFFAVSEDAARPVQDVLAAAGETIAREPGIVLRRAVAPEDGISAVYELEFWGTFKTYASVLGDT